MSSGLDARTHQVNELNEKNSALEANCKKMTEQLSTLSNDLQSAEDVNMNLVERIDHLKEEIVKKGLFYRSLSSKSAKGFLKEMDTLHK